ncbi:MAG: hypothetical protein ACRERW_05920 [Pseudomonas sp.]|uniref:Uncharacterized protein n=1 Tax=Pseudomonas frederiksbergensis TaxID=104087 RepID=A0A1J0ET75_9PSED|nr:hypothetical protein [Pseudomonas frederiksbergensis]APC14213.1 hypothetical protein BLL42_00045 [Pseudomonas frederiksbergensis]APC19107.1 hypothetical protein BLL42_26680 [Pseudomonas frederiksbergensis]APC19119.1 hypothetical protein BLL42_26740 [Pseudomonas frederiksbergensis]
MASSQKQAKRAQRAKEKAKKARVVRNNISRYEDSQTVETIETTEASVALFKKMKAAQEKSRVDMLVTLMQDEFVSSAETALDATDIQRILLAMYHRWNNSADQMVPGWLDDPEFKEDYAQAAKIADKEEYVTAWDEESAES